MRRAGPLLLGTGLCPRARCWPVSTRSCSGATSSRIATRGISIIPLYRVVQQEWAAGRWPLWNPWQNAGTPLLGMPMAAVLYPGKLLYAVLPYPQAARSYIIGPYSRRPAGDARDGAGPGIELDRVHDRGARLRLRGPGPVQYGNVIFLVGAAWMPWGFRAIHRLAGQADALGRDRAAVVLAMQVLGGDPEAAYLTVVSGALYAGVVAFSGQRQIRRDAGAAGALRPDGPWRSWRPGPPSSWGRTRRDEGMGPDCG